jgi:hypothetical protein
MSRARGTPLSVKNFSSSIDPRLYFETATSVHLDFTILCPARRILIDDALKRDAPKQEVLTMIEAQTRVPKLLLTGQLLGGNCCLLRELTVVGFVLRSVLNFSGLKQLTLRSCMDGDRSHGFFDILSGISQLGYLSIIRETGISGVPHWLMDEDEVLALYGKHAKTFLS